MESTENEIVIRHDIPAIYRIKLKFLGQIKAFQELEQVIEITVKEIEGSAPYRVDYRYGDFSKCREIKYIDRICWRYLVNLFELYKYMLCTDYEKMKDQIEDFNFPEFTIENAEGWLAGLKDVIYDNIRTLIKTVFENITEDTYYTGSGYSNLKKKKRNNNGIDKNFILTTNDYSRIFGYYSSKPTLTDDLEKVCYIMDGKTVPEITLKQIMRQEKKVEFTNDYFKIKICQNGNTHYTLFDESRNKLNLYGAGKGIIGEDIKIKIFEKT